MNQAGRQVLVSGLGRSPPWLGGASAPWGHHGARLWGSAGTEAGDLGHRG